MLHQPPTQPRALGDMYTLPPTIALKPEELDNERKKFEGELKSYDAIRNAEATRLTDFVFAASASIAARS